VTAIVFDLDDTLYDRTQPLKNAFLALESTKHIDFDLFQKAFQINSEIAFNQFKQNSCSLKESHIYRIKETLNHFGMQIPDETALNFQSLYEDNQQYIKLDPYIKDILELLQARKIRKYIITNGPGNHQRKKIQTLGLDQYFEPNQIIVSGEVGIAKPTPAIFELAENNFDLDKRNTWYVGDSYENDVIGANRVGWHTIWYNKDRKKAANNIATHTVLSTEQLKPLLINLLS
jgi:putative hydrolase of the HAD superfamily